MKKLALILYLYHSLTVGTKMAIKIFHCKSLNSRKQLLELYKSLPKFFSAQMLNTVSSTNIRKFSISGFIKFDKFWCFWYFSNINKVYQQACYKVVSSAIR